MDIWHLLTDYWWIVARGFGIAVPFFFLGRLQRMSDYRMSAGLIGLGYLLTIALASIVSEYTSNTLLYLLLLLAIVASSIGRYVSFTTKADRILLVSAIVAVAIEPIIDEKFRYAWGDQLRITYDTLLASTAFDLTPTWMRTDSVGVANYVIAPSILSQIGMSVLAMTFTFVVVVLILHWRLVSIEVRYQWAMMLSLGGIFLILPNHLFILAIVVLAVCLGGRCRSASIGLSYAWVFRPPAGRGIRLWAVIAVYVILYHLIYAWATVARVGAGPGGFSVRTNWFAVCLGIGLLSLLVGMLFRVQSNIYPVDAPKAFGILQICIGVLGIFAVAKEISRTGIAIVHSPDSLLLGLVLIYAIPGTLAGIALVAKRSWARVVGIGVSVIDIIVMPLQPLPVGILVGGLGILLLWGKRGRQKFNQDIRDMALEGNDVEVIER